jgi:hypothetical protein
MGRMSCNIADCLICKSKKLPKNFEAQTHWLNLFLAGVVLGVVVATLVWTL